MSNWFINILIPSRFTDYLSNLLFSVMNVLQARHYNQLPWKRGCFEYIQCDNIIIIMMNCIVQLRINVQLRAFNAGYSNRDTHDIILINSHHLMLYLIAYFQPEVISGLLYPILLDFDLISLIQPVRRIRRISSFSSW